MMKERLNGRAAKTLIGLGRQLAKDKDDITFLQLQVALRQFHIGITPEVCVCSQSHIHIFNFIYSYVGLTTVLVASRSRRCWLCGPHQLYARLNGRNERSS